MPGQQTKTQADAPQVPTMEEWAEERKRVARDAWERNHPKSRTEAPPMKRWSVTCDELHATVTAPNEADAWAKACDEWKKWPSPKSFGRKVELVSD